MNMRVLAVAAVGGILLAGLFYSASAMPRMEAAVVASIRAAVSGPNVEEAVLERLAERKNQMGGQEMAFKRVDLATASGAVTKWAQLKKRAAGLHAASFDGKTYILVSRGEKPNPGYGIKIQKVIEEPNRIAVYVSLSNPEPGKMYAQVITTPYDLVEIPQTAKPVELKTPIE